jgi:hypothetical protein
MQFLLITFLCIALFPLSNLGSNASAVFPASPTSVQQQSVSVTTAEGNAMKTLRVLLSAERAFQNTAGNGEFGDLEQLHSITLIDKALASGVVGGYRYTVAVKKSTLTSPPSVDLLARPIKYGKDSRRSFYLNESDVLLTSEVKDAAIADMRPFANASGAKPPPQVITEAPPDGDGDGEEQALTIAANEAEVIATLRAIHSAQAAFKAKPNAEFASLDQLVKQRLLAPERAALSQHGYKFEVAIAASQPNSPSAYSVLALPETYGLNGRRSFYIDQSGVLRGADKEGGGADPKDPAIVQENK